MGYFKAISRGRRKRLHFIYLSLWIILILLFIYLCRTKIKIKNSDIKDVLTLYLQLDLNEKESIFILKENPVKEEKQSVDNKPLVYIYNTHPQEKYTSKRNEYNLDYDVIFASQILKSYLEEKGIIALLETNLVSDILKKEGLSYAKSYEVSRRLLQQKKDQYPSLDYFIDLHRDSSSYEITTCEIDQQKYAKILFVIGLEHDDYEKNKDVVNNLNKLLIEYNNCLSRGIMEKSGSGVNGIYNQDFDPHVILIEVGGKDNNIEEVNRTLEVFAYVLVTYIEGSYE